MPPRPPPSPPFSPPLPIPISPPLAALMSSGPPVPPVREKPVQPPPITPVDLATAADLSPLADSQWVLLTTAFAVLAAVLFSVFAFLCVYSKWKEKQYRRQRELQTLQATTEDPQMSNFSRQGHLVASCKDVLLQQDATATSSPLPDGYVCAAAGTRAVYSFSPQRPSLPRARGWSDTSSSAQFQNPDNKLTAAGMVSVAPSRSRRADDTGDAVLSRARRAQNVQVLFHTDAHGEEENTNVHTSPSQRPTRTSRPETTFYL